MIRRNWIAADRDDKLIYLDEALLETVLWNGTTQPLGYGAGRLEDGDAIAMVIPAWNRLANEDRQAVQRFCGGQLLDAEGCPGWVILGAVHRQTAKPLIKAIGRDGSGLLLDTVFLGYPVQVTAEETGELAVDADGRQVRSSMEAEVTAVVFNGNGVRYFRTDNQATAGISLAALLEGKAYPAFWDAARMAAEGRTLQQVIRPEILALLEGSEAGEQAGALLGDVEGRKVIVQRMFDVEAPGLGADSGTAPRNAAGSVTAPGSVAHLPFRVWRILTEGDVAELLMEDARVYEAMGQTAASNSMTAGYTFGLRGEDEKIRKIRYLLQKSAPTNTTILLTGESGTGKTFLAREIHKHSKRAGGAFVHVNCAAIPYNLIESELFGYEEGAFTGAKKGGKNGYFQMAEGGTLFLDEITELPLSLQGKLLEVLQSRTYFSIGGEKKKAADVRLIAATNKDLNELVRSHRFREDLFYRINVFPIQLPPLRERLSSLFSIVTDLLPDICGRLDVGQQVISMAALEKMRDYDWPGNIRELENVLEKACILSDGKIIMPSDVELKQPEEQENPAVKPLKQQREDFEKKVIKAALERNRGSRIKTARELAIGKTSLFEKMKKYGLEDAREDLDDVDEEDHR